jgi:S-adenosyl-methyltransferase mraW
MRMDTSTGETAAEWIARADAAEMAKVFKDLGEERFAMKAAKAIEKARVKEPILRTKQLADLIAATLPRNKKDSAQHPATRIFQAIRIHVNQELEQLKRALESAGSLLLPDGVLAVISFHSLEDRIVKKFFEAAANPASGINPRLPLLPSQLPQPLFNRAVRILPSEKECEENPRARSSVLRGASRTDAPWPEQGVRV